MGNLQEQDFHLQASVPTSRTPSAAESAGNNSTVGLQIRGWRPIRQEQNLRLLIGKAVKHKIHKKIAQAHGTAIHTLTKSKMTLSVI